MRLVRGFVCLWRLGSTGISAGCALEREGATSKSVKYIVIVKNHHLKCYSKGKQEIDVIALFGPEFWFKQWVRDT